MSGSAPAGRIVAASGPLEADNQADIVSERDGRVTSVKVDIGDHVHRGQLLALLDNRALEAVRKEKMAKLEALRAEVQTWDAQQKSNEADMRRAATRHADEEWERLKNKLAETVAQVARCKAEVLAAEADLHAADVELDQSRIVAPFDGVVGRKTVHQAAGVRKGEALFWVAAQAPLHIVFKVPEASMALFSRGAKLELTTADYPRLKQTASVFRVSPVVDPSSGSVQVIGYVERPSPLLKPGMSMQVKLSPQ